MKVEVPAYGLHQWHTSLTNAVGGHFPARTRRDSGVEIEGPKADPLRPAFLSMTSRVEPYGLAVPLHMIRYYYHLSPRHYQPRRSKRSEVEHFQ